VIASLAPGTQWSQKPTDTLPAACAPCMNGNGSALDAATTAADFSTPRRVIVFLMNPPNVVEPVTPANALPVPVKTARILSLRCKNASDVFDLCRAAAAQKLRRVRNTNSA